MAKLKLKLSSMRKRILKRGQSNLTAASRDVGRYVLHVGSAKSWHADTHDSPKGSLARATSQAVTAAREVDAAELLAQYALNGAKYYDITIPKDLSLFRDRVQEAFKTKRIQKRGVVYVSWRLSPLKFVYVGKASTPGRIDPKLRGDILSGGPTTLSIIFPSSGGQKAISELEAALLYIVYVETGRLPINNNRFERLSKCEGFRQLDDMGLFFNQLQAKLNDTRKKMNL